MQLQVKSAALQRDTMKASELAAEVSTSKPVVLLIHGGAQGGLGVELSPSGVTLALTFACILERKCGPGTLDHDVQWGHTSCVNPRGVTSLS